MTKSVNISDAVHEQLRAKADRVGMTLRKFVERAIAAYDPVVTLVPAEQPRPPRQRRRAM